MEKHIKHYYLRTALDAYKFFSVVTYEHSEYTTKFAAYYDGFDVKQSYVQQWNVKEEELYGKLNIYIEFLTRTGIPSPEFAEYVDKYIREQMSLSLEQLKSQ